MPFPVGYTDKNMWAKTCDTVSFRSDILGTKRVVSMLDNVKNKKILDLGCGNGNVSRILALKGARVVGIDIVKEQIEIAKSATKSKNIEYIQADMMKSHKLLKNKKFDIVLSMMSQLCLSEADFKQSFKVIAKSLKKNGRFIYLNIHPCRILSNLDTLSYFQTNKLESTLPTLVKKAWHTAYFHHPLNLVVNSMVDAGLTVKQVYEPQATKREMSQYPTLLSTEDKVPSYIIIDCIKK